MLGRAEEALRNCDAFARGPHALLMKSFLDFTRATLRRDHEQLLRLMKEFMATSFHDPEGYFFNARALAFVGLDDEAMRLLEQCVKGGFYAVALLDRDPWLESLRARPDFLALRGYAADQRQACIEAFVRSGGETLLGVAS